MKRSHEANPFVRAYVIPRSGFIGPLFGMELTLGGNWMHLDYADYGDGELVDDELAKRCRERDPAKVVSREMIDLDKRRPG